ncbi:DUF4255 domain-containing protein [Cupriavidus pampae]|uniref:Pvc16 N-terminal domain-containing protein n=1 Tax=Cupriavidus pampae TaxID=659251 RepID=A0ABN7ZQA0_9BURK|nr:DUF4255 domain-containing protein [Cupriavidus pampae]CAG9186481.1 hypothetical protein LMG32289_06460 [Cupriavidus pampae]
MIESALGILALQLNQMFRRHVVLAEDLVVVSNLQELDGSAVPLVANKLVLFVAGIERDTSAHRLRPSATGEHRSQVVGPEPLYLNLLILCAATFGGQNYPEALKFLSDAMAFFQANPVFNHQNAPDLDARIDRIMVHIENLSASEMHSLWSIHGGRYLPSVMYRARLVCLDAGATQGREPLVGQPDVAVRPGVRP